MFLLLRPLLDSMANLAMVDFKKMEIVFQPLIGLLVLLQLQLRLPSLLVKTMLVLLELTILVLPKPRPSMKVSPLNTPLIVH